jgi:hypothetical protein
LALKITEFLENNKFDLTVTTRDWHPKDHRSFCSNNQINSTVGLFEEIVIPET